jgi:diguanylate cyclase (GGDEF)-like protein/PAS domain S-box-containing protein
MSLSRLFSRYRVELAFASAVLILLVAGISSHRAIQTSQYSVSRVHHTYQVMASIDDLVAALSAVQSSSRSFALTGDESYLQIHEAAAAKTNQTIDELKLLTRNNAEQQQSMPNVAQLASRNLQLATALIAKRQFNGLEAAIPMLRLGEGPRALEQFRELASVLKNREVQLLEQREEKSNRDFALTQGALALATLLGLIITIAAGVGTVCDIRKRRKAEADLFLEKERAQVTLASIGDGVMRADIAGNVTFLNRAGTELTGWSEEEAVGKPLSHVFAVIDAATRDPIASRMQTAVVEGQKARLPETALLLRRDGKEVPIEDTVAPIHDREGNFAGAVNVFRDVSEARENAQRLQHSAHHDSLTGLPNRILLADRIGQAIALSERRGTRIALLYLDLDGFKLINDTKGHGTGDKLLKSVSERLAFCVRECDTVSRVGGDEFVVLLTDIAGAQDAATTAQRILSCLSLVHMIDGAELAVSASIGISLCPGDAENAEQLLSNADAAMYEAKSGGRTRFVFFSAPGNLDAEQLKTSAELGSRS